MLTQHKSFTSKELKNSKIVVKALVDCLNDGDTESFRDVLISHLITKNKVELARKSGVARRTIYSLFDTKKTFNPELLTLISLIREI